MRQLRVTLEDPRHGRPSGGGGGVGDGRVEIRRRTRDQDCADRSWPHRAPAYPGRRCRKPLAMRRTE